jgi:hypothetical protein
LEVEKDGEINVDIAYHNTIFIIGNKKIYSRKTIKKCTCLHRKRWKFKRRKITSIGGKENEGDKNISL